MRLPRGCSYPSSLLSGLHPVSWVYAAMRCSTPRGCKGPTTLLFGRVLGTSWYGCVAYLVAEALPQAPSSWFCLTALCVASRWESDPVEDQQKGLRVCSPWQAEKLLGMFLKLQQLDWPQNNCLMLLL